MESLDRILVVDADGHVNEGDVDLSSRLPEAWRSQGPVSGKDNQGYPRILLEGRIWGTAQGPGPSFAQKERILGRNAVEFFALANLPEPSALGIARKGWERSNGGARR